MDGSPGDAVQDERGVKKHVWYMASATARGHDVPHAHDERLLHRRRSTVNDYFNFTVNDAGRAARPCSARRGRRATDPPGERGRRRRHGTSTSTRTAQKVGTWTSTFPDYQDKARASTFWKPYPNFLMVTLPAGLQVIKLQSTSKHLNLDYVQFDLMGASWTVAPARRARTRDGAPGRFDDRRGWRASGGTAGAGAGQRLATRAVAARARAAAPRAPTQRGARARGSAGATGTGSAGTTGTGSGTSRRGHGRQELGRLRARAVGSWQRWPASPRVVCWVIAGLLARRRRRT